MDLLDKFYMMNHSDHRYGTHNKVIEDTVILIFGEELLILFVSHHL